MIHQVAAIVSYLKTQRNLNKKKINDEKNEKGPKRGETRRLAIAMYQ